MTLPSFSVVIPCFNEAARIGETLRLTLDYLTANAPESELIVVNDGSIDATAAIARESLKDAKIEIDIAFGSRALDRGLIGIHQPWRREQAGRAFNLLVRVATGLPFWDTQCGFKAFRLDVCRPIVEAVRLDGFAFDVELLYLAQHAGLRVREIPVRWNHAEGSKVQFFKDSLRMLREVIALRARRRHPERM